MSFFHPQPGTREIVKFWVDVLQGFPAMASASSRWTGADITARNGIRKDTDYCRKPPSLSHSCVVVPALSSVLFALPVRVGPGSGGRGQSLSLFVQLFI
jgi:hypothetical protein